MASDSTNQLVTLLRRWRKRRMARHTSALPSSVPSTRAPSRHPVSARSTHGPPPGAALPIGGAAPAPPAAPAGGTAPEAAAGPPPASGCASGRPRGHLCPPPSVCPAAARAVPGYSPAGCRGLASRRPARRRRSRGPGGGAVPPRPRGGSGRRRGPLGGRAGPGWDRGSRAFRPQRRDRAAAAPGRSGARGPRAAGPSGGRPGRDGALFPSARGELSPQHRPGKSPLPVLSLYLSKCPGRGTTWRSPSVSFWRPRSHLREQDVTSCRFTSTGNALRSGYQNLFSPKWYCAV